jgi:hypothetical protein
MRYLSIYRTDAKRVNTPPTQENMARMGQLIEKSFKNGTLIATGGVMSNPKGAIRVRRAGSKVTITDGPFTEAKELIGGFAVLEATSREHAIELIEEFLDVAGEGECEVHELAPMPTPESFR